jgi:endoglucanase
MRLLFCLLTLTSALMAEEPVPHLAASARLFLRVPDGSPPIGEVRVSPGVASPGTYESTPEKRERLTDINVPIHWWSWTKVEVSFTPTYDGTIELDLNGPWGEARPGVLQQMEVLWQTFSAIGSTIENPGFKRTGEGAPEGWKSPWRPYPASAVWPLTAAEPAKGSTFGASWHGRPLTQSIPVKKGVAVTLKFEALGAQPSGFVGMKPLVGSGPAYLAAAKLKRGVNLGNNWESPPGEWGIKFDKGDLDQIAAEGFDHLRVPVAWQHRLKDGKLDPTFLAEIEPMLRHALSKRMRIILNWQHFDELSRDPEGRRAEFMRVWNLIATHFKDWPQELMFELINEPNTKMDGAVMISIYAEAITTIRRTNPGRTILVDPPQWASCSTLDRLVLPEKDDNIIVSVHCYDPFEFTHQGASWVGLTDLKGIIYPGPPSSPLSLPASLQNAPDRAAWIKDYNRLPAAENPCSKRSIERALDQAIHWSRYFGRPIHLGEFGSNRLADPASRNRYARDVKTVAEARRIPWTLWEWKAGFGYWDPQTNKPLLREALFGK